MMLVLSLPPSKLRTFIGHPLCQTWCIGTENAKVGGGPSPHTAHRPVRELIPDVEEFAIRNKPFVRLDTKCHLFSIEKKVRVIVQNYPMLTYPVYL